MAAKSTRIGSCAPILYALVIRGTDDKIIGTVGTPRDQAGARGLCRSIFKMYPHAAYVDIVSWYEGCNLEAAQPVDTVNADDLVEE